VTSSLALRESRRAVMIEKHSSSLCGVGSFRAWDKVVGTYGSKLSEILTYSDEAWFLRGGVEGSDGATRYIGYVTDRG
jgi:hypothetical protein